MKKMPGTSGCFLPPRLAGVVETYGEDLSGFTGHERLYVGEVVPGGGLLHITVDAALYFSDSAVFDYAVGSSAVGLESCEFHGCVSGVSWDGVGGLRHITWVGWGGQSPASKPSPDSHPGRICDFAGPLHCMEEGVLG